MPPHTLMVDVRCWWSWAKQQFLGSFPFYFCFDGPAVDSFAVAVFSTAGAPRLQVYHFLGRAPGLFLRDWFRHQSEGKNNVVLWKRLYSASSWSKLLLRFMGPYFGACLFQHFQILGGSWSWQASDVRKKENMYAEEIQLARVEGTTYSDIFDLVWEGYGTHRTRSKWKVTVQLWCGQSGFRNIVLCPDSFGRL